MCDFCMELIQMSNSGCITMPNGADKVMYNMQRAPYASD